MSGFPGGPPYSTVYQGGFNSLQTPGYQTPYAQTPQRAYAHGQQSQISLQTGMRPLPYAEQQEQAMMAQTIEIIQLTAINAVRERDALVREINVLRGVRFCCGAVLRGS